MRRKLIATFRRFDAALILACFMLAVTATVALANSHVFLNQSEPPGGGNNNGYEEYNTHIWGWAQNGSACVHSYIKTTNSWTSPSCAEEAPGTAVNVYYEYTFLGHPGAWNNPNLYYGTHLTQGEQWW
jgi:hypothetical protein